MAGEKDKKDDNPFEGFKDHTDADNIQHADDDSAANADVDNDADDADDGQDDNQKELDLGEENGDEGDDELDDAMADEDADEEEGGEDDGDDDDQDEDEGAGDFDDDAEADPEPAPKKKRSVSARIAEFRKRTGQAERRATAAEATNATLQARLDKIEARLTPDGEGGTSGDDDAASPGSDLKKPSPDDYTYGEMDSKYQEDLTDYKVDVKLAERDAKQETSQQSEAAAQQAKELQKTFTTKVEEGITAYEDFDEVVVKAADNRDYPLSETVAMLGLESPEGHHVLYKIATDLALAKKIDALPPHQQAREFGRLEAQFARRTSPKNKNKPNAGPPASRRRGGKSGSTRTKGNTSDFTKFENQANADEARRNKR